MPLPQNGRIGQHGVVLLRRLPLGGQLGIVGALDGRSVVGLYVRMVLFT